MGRCSWLRGCDVLSPTSLYQIVCALYPDPVKGYPPKYARDDVPKITKWVQLSRCPCPGTTDGAAGLLATYCCCCDSAVVV